MKSPQTEDFFLLRAVNEVSGGNQDADERIVVLGKSLTGIWSSVTHFLIRHFVNS